MNRPNNTLHLTGGWLSMVLIAGCARPQPPPPVAGSGDAAFGQLATAILEDYYKRDPSEATNLGIHKYDDQLEDLSEAALKAESAALKDFRSQLTAVDPATLTLNNALDREQLIHSLDARVLSIDTIKM